VSEFDTKCFIHAFGVLFERVSCSGVELSNALISRPGTDGRSEGVTVERQVTHCKGERMKSKDDFSQAQLRTFHGRLSKAATKEDRAVVFKEIGALPQAVGQWFRHMGLAPLGAPGETNAKPKAGGKGKAKIAATGKKAGRPKGSKNSPQAPHLSVEGTSAPRPRNGSGISIEAKEMLIRLMDKLLSD